MFYSDIRGWEVKILSLIYTATLDSQGTVMQYASENPTGEMFTKKIMPTGILFPFKKSCEIQMLK